MSSGSSSWGRVLAWIAGLEPPPPPRPHHHLAVLLQAEATYYGTPRVEAFQLEGSLNGVDLLPLMQSTTTTQQAGGIPAAPGAVTTASLSTSATGSSSSSVVFGAEAPPALVDGSRVRLRVSGGLRLSAVRDEGPAARRQAGLTGEGGYLFTGGWGWVALGEWGAGCTWRGSGMCLQDARTRSSTTIYDVAARSAA